MLQEGADFLGVAGFEGVRFEQVKHQEAGVALVEFIDQVFDSALLDVLSGDRRFVDEGEFATVAGDHPFGFEAVQKSGDGGVGPESSGGLQGFKDLPDGSLFKLPQDFQHVEFGVGERRRSFRHGFDFSSRGEKSSRRTCFATSVRRPRGLTVPPDLSILRWVSHECQPLLEKMSVWLDGVEAWEGVADGSRGTRERERERAGGDGRGASGRLLGFGLATFKLTAWNGSMGRVLHTGSAALFEFGRLSCRSSAVGCTTRSRIGEM